MRVPSHPPQPAAIEAVAADDPPKKKKRMTKKEKAKLEAEQRQREEQQLQQQQQQQHFLQHPAARQQMPIPPNAGAEYHHMLQQSHGQGAVLQQVMSIIYVCVVSHEFQQHYGQHQRAAHQNANHGAPPQQHYNAIMGQRGGFGAAGNATTSSPSSQYTVGGQQQYAQNSTPNQHPNWQGDKVRHAVQAETLHDRVLKFSRS